MSDIRVSIVTYNSADTIRRCLTSLDRAAGSLSYTISILDNASSDNTLQVLDETDLPFSLEASGKNLGFGAGHNRNLLAAEEPYFLLLNPDAWLLAGSIPFMRDRLAADSALAAVGPRVEYPDGSPQVSFGSFPSLRNDVLHRSLTHGAKQRDQRILATLERLLLTERRPHWISGSCMLVRRTAFLEAGGFDEGYFLYLEDVDICRRWQQLGWSVGLEPAAICRHIEGHSLPEQSSGQQAYRASRLRYENKFGSRIMFWLYAKLKARGLKVEWDDSLCSARGGSGQ